MSYPLGLRAKLKGPQTKKRVLMKHQISTYFIQVRLPAAMQRSLRERSNAEGGEDGFATRGTSSLPRLRSVACTQITPSVRLPLFTDEELESSSFAASSFRGVVTVTIPSAASCYDAIGYILAAAVDDPHQLRSPMDYQLTQCFADFTPDHTRRRLTGDSTTVPIKTVMQFPYHLALVLSPFVVLRERVEEDEEPQQRSIIFEGYRKQFLQFCVGYQSLLFRLIEQTNFLRGREEEARRGKKLEERQQFFELARFRTLRQEKDIRGRIAKQVEFTRRAFILLEEQAVREKRLLCEGDTSLWLREHSRWLVELKRQLHTLLSQDGLLQTLRHRADDLSRLLDTASDSLVHSKQWLYNVSRIALSVHESAAAADVAVVTPQVIEAHRRRCAPLVAPQLYLAQPMIANALAILEDVHSSARSQVL
jgi:hypothetical protein